LLAPELVAVPDVVEFDANGKVVASLRDAARKYGLDAKGAIVNSRWPARRRHAATWSSMLSGR